MAVVNLADAISYVSAIVNAADWKTVNDVVTNGTTTVTSATASFASSDRGKWVSIAAAGASNKPHLAYIASVTNSTTIVLSAAPPTTISAGASMMYGGRSEDPRHSLWTITQAVLQKDLLVCHEILKHPNHSRRNHFTFTTASIAQTNTGAPMTSHSGLLRMVEIQHTDTTWRVGKWVPPAMLPKLLTWLNNRGSLFTSASQGYYTIADGQIYFVGSNVRLTYVDLTLDATACQAPQEYMPIVCALAAADLFATEGDDLQAAQVLAEMGLGQNKTLTDIIKQDAGEGELP